MSRALAALYLRDPIVMRTLTEATLLLQTLELASSLDRARTLPEIARAISMHAGTLAGARSARLHLAEPGDAPRTPLWLASREAVLARYPDLCRPDTHGLVVLPVSSRGAITWSFDAPPAIDGARRAAMIHAAEACAQAIARLSRPTRAEHSAA